MTELTGNQWIIYSGSILVTQQINHNPRCLKNVNITLRISKNPSVINAPPHICLHPLSVQVPSLPSVWVQVPQVVSCLGTHMVLHASWGEVPHTALVLWVTGWVQGAPSPHGELLGMAQAGMRCHAVTPGSAQPGLLLLVQLQGLYQHFLHISLLLLHCFSGWCPPCFKSLFVISWLLFNLVDDSHGVPS